MKDNTKILSEYANFKDTVSNKMREQEDFILGKFIS